MTICTTPSLGFSPTLKSANYPYTVGLGLPSPQIGSLVHVAYSTAANGAHWEMAETSPGVYGWREQAAAPGQDQAGPEQD